jgi:hypothetical protein
MTFCQNMRKPQLFPDEDIKKREYEYSRFYILVWCISINTRDRRLSNHLHRDVSFPGHSMHI